jgi:hypothetical protein
MENRKLGTSGTGEDIRKGCRRRSVVEILCTRVCKWKNENFWKYSRNGGMRNKGE